METTETTSNYSSRYENFESFRGIGFRIDRVEKLDDPVTEWFVWKSARVSARVDMKKKIIQTTDEASVVGVLVNELLDDGMDRDAITMLRCNRSCSLSDVADVLKPRIVNLLLATRSLDPMSWSLRPSREEKKLQDEASLEISKVLFMPKSYDGLSKLILIGHATFDEPNAFAHALFWSFSYFNKNIYDAICQAAEVRMLDAEDIATKLHLASDNGGDLLTREQVVLNGLLAVILPGRNITPSTYEKWVLRRLKAILNGVGWLRPDSPNELFESIAEKVKLGTVAGAKRYQRMLRQRQPLLEKYVDWIISGVPACTPEHPLNKLCLHFCFHARMTIQYFRMTSIRFTNGFITKMYCRKWSSKAISEQASRYREAYDRIEKSDEARFPYLGVLNSPLLKELSKAKYRDLVYCAIRDAKAIEEKRAQMVGFGYDQTRFETAERKRKLKKLMKKPPKLSLAESLVESFGRETFEQMFAGRFGLNI